MPFYKAYGLSIFSEIELTELNSAEPSEICDLRILIGKVDSVKLKKTQVFRRGIQAYFGESNAGDLILHWDDVADYQAKDGNVLIVSPLTTSPGLLSLFTVSEAIGLILFQKGYFLLHASAIKIGQEAWCFMGSPGAGKSTTAAAFVKAGCPLLSDDLTAIQFDINNKPFVIPGYPQLKIWDTAVEGLSYSMEEVQPVSEGIKKFSFKQDGNDEQDLIPLTEVFFLHNAKNRAALELLSPTQIPTETLKTFPLPGSLMTGDSLKRHFIQSFQCAVSARIWKKRRPANFALLESWVQESISLQSDTLNVR